MSAYINEILNQLKNPSPKKELLPYQYYDLDNDFVINIDSNVGFLLELKPVVGVSDNVVKQLSLLFDEFIPEGGYLQFMMIASSDTSGITGSWLEQYAEAEDLLKSLAKQRVDYLQQLTQKGEGAYRIKDYRIVVSFSKKVTYNKAAISELNNFRTQLEAILRSCGISLRRIGINEFLQITGEIIAPNSIASEYNPHDPISGQIAKGSPLLFDYNKITHKGDFISKAYTFEQTPKEFSLDEMINLLGDSMRDNLQIPGRLIINYTISNDISEKKQAVLRDKGNSLIKQIDNYLIKFDVLAKKEIAEWTEAEKVINNGKKLLSTSLNILLTERKEDFHKAEQYLTSVYVTNGFRIKSLDYFMLPAFLSCLPFGPSVGLFNLFKKFSLSKTTVSTEPLAFTPIHGEWKGNSREGLLFAGRRGQLFTLDIFTGESNNNANVIGQPGSGKSVLLQDVIVNLIATNTKAFVLDIGRSYEKICKLLGGDFVEFKIDSNICLNPFDCIHPQSKEEESDFLSLILPILSKMAAPKRGTTDEEDAILAFALHKVWESQRNGTTITKIADCLSQESSEIANRLGRMLFQYTDKGNYGRFFNGKSNVNFKNRLTVFEFEELRERKDLLAVIMQMLSAQIMTQIFSGNREIKSVIAFDEGWFALDLFPRMLSEISKTIRKYWGSLLIGTQSINDYFVNDIAKAILENAGWLFMLKQKKESIDLLLEAKRLAFDEGQIQLIKSLSVVPGKYSECLISSSSGYVVGRLILDPYSRVLYSTSPQEFNAVQKLMKSGLSVDQAVETIARSMYA